MPESAFKICKPTSIAATGTGANASIREYGSVSFTSCDTLSLDGVFTNIYLNYMIVMRYVGTVNGSSMRCKLRASGTDDSTTNAYVTQDLSVTGTSITTARYTSNFAYVGAADDTHRGGNTLFVFGPYSSQPTAARSATVDGFSDAYISDQAVTHNQFKAYDGLTLYPTTGNITGLITVYGCNQ